MQSARSSDNIDIVYIVKHLCLVGVLPCIKIVMGANPIINIRLVIIDIIITSKSSAVGIAFQSASERAASALWVFVVFYCSCYFVQSARDFVAL